MSRADDILNAPIRQKPHHGRISEWEIKDWFGRDIVVGRFLDHPEFDGNEIETRNSRYTLV